MEVEEQVAFSFPSVSRTRKNWRSKLAKKKKHYLQSWL